MKKMIFLVILGCLVGSIAKSHIYLWEQMAESGPSCCLHFDGADICNPNMGCSNYMEGDLAGIIDYAMRLLSTERGAVEPYHTELLQVTKYIRRAFVNQSYFISYRFDQHRNVPFYHELIDAALRSKDKGGSRIQAQKQQSKHDYVTECLIKSGLFIPHKKDNKI